MKRSLLLSLQAYCQQDGVRHRLLSLKSLVPPRGTCWLLLLLLRRLPQLISLFVTSSVRLVRSLCRRDVWVLQHELRSPTLPLCVPPRAEWCCMLHPLSYVAVTVCMYVYQLVQMIVCCNL